MSEEVKEPEEEKVVDQETKGPEVQEVEKTFTQTELNAILKKTKGEEASRILKDLGVEDVPKGKAAIAKLAELQKANMTETEKAKTDLEETNTKLTKSEQRAANLETKLAAIELGADLEQLDVIIKILPEGDEPIKDRLKSLLESKTFLLKKGSGIPKGSETKTQETDQADKMKALIRKNMGLDNKK